MTEEEFKKKWLAYFKEHGIFDNRSADKRKFIRDLDQLIDEGRIDSYDEGEQNGWESGFEYGYQQGFSESMDR